MTGRTQTRGREGQARIGASPAGATQRAQNARLPLARADLKSRGGEIDPSRSFRRELSPAPPPPRVMERRVGEIVSVHADHGVFAARFRSQLGDRHEQEERFPTDWVPAEMLASFIPGAKFDVVVSESSTTSADEARIFLEIRFVKEEKAEAAIVAESGSTSALPFGELVNALNAGVLTGEIDEAIGWDPELAV